MNLEEELDNINIDKLPVLSGEILEQLDPKITALFKAEATIDKIISDLQSTIYSYQGDQKRKNELFSAFGTVIEQRRQVNDTLCAILERVSGRD